MARTYQPDPATIALGVEIQAEMTAQEMTAVDLAARLGVGRDTLGDWLRARRALPMTMYMLIARELRIPAHELIIRAEERARRDAARARARAED